MTPKPFSAFLLHLHPRTVPAETMRLTLSFGLGGMAATLFFLLLFTGVLQLISYAPSVQHAFDSIGLMYGGNNLAGFIRNSHYWAGNLLVVLVCLHLLRVFLTGALDRDRRMNWLIGIFLFLLALFANFTGYLLPWDQRAYWAVTIFISMLAYLPLFGEQLAALLRGGPEVGQQTLAAFFAIHAGLIPVLMTILALYHFWLVRKAGGLIQTGRPAAEVKRLPAVPHLIEREAATGLSIMALVLVVSALFDAPLGEEANPAASPNPAKAAWYFMGLQELLLHLHPFFAIFLVPALMLGGLFLLPVFKPALLPGGTWFGGAGGFRIAGLSCFAGLVAMTALISVDDLLLRDGLGQASSWLLRGAVPVGGFILLLIAWFYGWRRIGGRPAAEAAMAVLLFIVGTVIGLSVAGIWFRGPEMALIWPW